MLNRKIYVQNIQKLIYVHLFTEVLHEDFSSIVRRNIDLTSEIFVYRRYITVSEHLFTYTKCFLLANVKSIIPYTFSKLSNLSCSKII